MYVHIPVSVRDSVVGSQSSAGAAWWCASLSSPRFGHRVRVMGVRVSGRHCAGSRTLNILTIRNVGRLKPAVLEKILVCRGKDTRNRTRVVFFVLRFLCSTAVQQGITQGLGDAPWGDSGSLRPRHGELQLLKALFSPQAFGLSRREEYVTTSCG